MKSSIQLAYNRGFADGVQGRVADAKTTDWSKMKEATAYINGYCDGRERYNETLAMTGGAQ